MYDSLTKDGWDLLAATERACEQVAQESVSSGGVHRALSAASINFGNCSRDLHLRTAEEFSADLAVEAFKLLQSCAERFEGCLSRIDVAKDPTRFNVVVELISSSRIRLRSLERIVDLTCLS